MLNQKSFLSLFIIIISVVVSFSQPTLQSYPNQYLWLSNTEIKSFDYLHGSDPSAGVMPWGYQTGEFCRGFYSIVTEGVPETSSPGYISGTEFMDYVQEEAYSVKYAEVASNYGFEELLYAYNTEIKVFRQIASPTCIFQQIQVIPSCNGKIATGNWVEDISNFDDIGRPYYWTGSVMNAKINISFTTSWLIAFDPGYYSTKCQFAQMDYLFGGSEDEFIIAENHHIEIITHVGQIYSWYDIIDLGNYQTRDFCIADFNVDGYNDLIYCSDDITSSAIVYLNQGDGTVEYSEEWTNSLLSHVDILKVSVLEYNYDGKPDLLIWPSNTVSDYCYIYINTGNDFIYSEWEGNKRENDIEEILITDLYGLGAQSIMTCGSKISSGTQKGSILFFKSQGNARPCPPRNLWWDSNEDYHPVLHWELNIEDDINQYKVYRNMGEQQIPDPENWVHIATLDHPTCSYTDLDVWLYQHYFNAQLWYKVTATDDASNESLPSNIITFRALYHPSGGEAGEIAGITASNRIGLSASPNPFNNHTTLKLAIPESGNLEIKVYDIEGREKANIYCGYCPAGTKQFQFDSSSLPSGIYFCRVASEKEAITEKLLLVK